MAVLSKVANIAVQPQPVGVVEAFAGSNAPNGWLICDGSQVSRSLFPELFSVIGTTYGSGDGFSTFTLPDLRGRTIAGRDGVNNMNNGPTNRLTSTHFGASGTALGNSGGSESHTLTTAQLASHNHGVNDPSHRHGPSGDEGMNRYWQSSTGAGAVVQAGASYQGNNSIIYTGWASTGISIQNNGSGNAHNNTQPTMVLNYIIKAISELPRGGWYNSSSPDLVTSLPTNPYNGQEVYHSISGYPFHKRYNGATWDRTSNDVIICTSATRPASPFEGQRIYQTDDKRELIYNGVAWVTLTPVSATNNSQGSTASTSYTSSLTGLTGSTPSVTLQTGTSVLVNITTYTWTNTTFAWSAASPAVSGSTTLAASDDRSAGFETTSPGYGSNPSRTFAITSLTPGVNTFTVQYRVSSGTGQFLRTNLTVQGLP